MLQGANLGLIPVPSNLLTTYISRHVCAVIRQVGERGTMSQVTENSDVDERCDASVMACISISGLR